MTDDVDVAPTLLVTDRGPVRIITLNRPDRHNAFNTAMWTHLNAALVDARDTPQVAVVIITGAGGTFTAGQDLTEMADMTDAVGDNPPGTLMDTLIGYPVPLVVAVQGVAAGFGYSLVLHSDVAVVAEDARLGAPFTSIGLAPDGAASAILPERMGWQAAAHQLFTSGWIVGSEAATRGVAWKACPAHEVLDVANAVAEDIAKHPVAAVRRTKKLLIDARVDQWRAALDREVEALRELSATDAHRQAVEHFLAGRLRK